MKPLFADAPTASTTTQSDFDSLVQKSPSPVPITTLPARVPVPTKKYTMSEIDDIGKSSEEKVGPTTLTIINSVKASQTGEFGAKLNKLISETKGLDPKQLGKQGFVSRMLHIGGSLKDRMQAEFDTVKGRIDSLVAELDKTADNARKRVVDCEHLYEENFQTWNRLGEDITKLTQIAKELQEQIDDVPAAANGFEAQHKVDLQEMLGRVKKRINDLTLGRTLALQAAPDIRELQAGMRNLATTIRDVKVTTIPAYCAMFSRYIIAQEMKQGADLANAVADATNEALKAGATMLTDAAIAVAKAQERGVVDVETLEFMQQEAIKRMDEVAKIHADGEQKRKDAEPRLKKIEEHLISRSTKSN